MRRGLVQFGAWLGVAIVWMQPAAAQSVNGWAAEVFRSVTVATADPLVPQRHANALQDWDATIQYRLSSDTIDAPRAFATGNEALMNRPVFATLVRRFSGRQLSPYIGLGAGYAEGLVGDPERVRDGKLAFKGVFGTDIALEDDLDLYVEYGYALAPSADAVSDRNIKAHQVSTGLRLRLN